MKLFDSHSHLHFPQYDADRAEVLERMRTRGVGTVLIGTDFETSRRAVDLAHTEPFLWAAVGLHPNDPSTGSGQASFDRAAFEALARDEKVVAIGECGLDFFRSAKTPEEKAAQKERFLEHVELAETLHKALVIHCREAHEDMLAMLEAHMPRVPVVMHFFTGSGELAEKYLALGCYLSFPGPVTYTDMYDDSIRVAPLDKILIETDAPFAAPVPHKGKRNEPVFVEEVAAKIARVKGLLVGKIEEHTLENAKTCFGLPH